MSRWTSFYRCPRSGRTAATMTPVRYCLALFFGVTAICRAEVQAEEFQVVKVPSVASVPLDQLKSQTIIFNDYREHEISDRATGFIRFEDWSREMPLQKQLLNLHPAYAEATVTKTTDGLTSTYKDKAHVYTAEARFVLAKPAASIELTRYATLPFLERIDPAIKHKSITSSEITLLNEERNQINRNPDRQWCEGKSVTICVRSRYQLEGKLPMGVALANKIRETERKLSDYIEFENELRVLSPADVDEAALKKLTGIDTPVASVLEQSIFAVNQIMRFGKFVAVLQPHPSRTNNTVVTVMLAIAVGSTTLETKKNYETVPVLRNLVPAQVLMGNSSFNTGNSISSGLPNYARNRIKAIAENLSRD